MIPGRLLNLDGPLTIALLALSGLGLVVIYSASGESWDVMMRQAVRLGIAWGVLLLTAQITPETLRRFSPHMFIAGVIMLVAVLAFGVTAKGAQRWLDL